jgi:hypothetical protein
MTVNQHRDAEVDLELQVLYEIEQMEKQNTTIKMNYVEGHKQTTRSISFTDGTHAQPRG